MGKIRVDSRQNINIGGNRADHRQQVNRRLKRPRKNARARQEHIPDGSLGEVEGGRWAGALDDLEVQRVEDGPDEFSLGGRDVRPEQVPGLDDVEPFDTRFGRVTG